MKSSSTSKRLAEVMAARGMRQIDVLTAAAPYCEKYNVKIGKNALSQYLSGKVEPGQERLSILGMALGVSEAWLMGYDVPIEKNVTPITEEGNGRTQEYIELFSLLSDDQQALIVHAIKGLLSEK
ncbi:hypothetical protein RFF05_06550 [Bengtsoniella intestinalis]|uniref:DNA-binding protein n=1 Tax=Bengtsoniella intestinalis TaxID=3073143 RepID=UPI00391F744D